jgi:hypothetical protein
MRRVLSLAVILGLISPVALVGCGEETKVTDTQKTTTPGGTTTTTETKSVKTTGENPPPVAPK